MFCNNNNRKKIDYSDHESLREIVRDFVKEARYNHTISMENEAERLAEIFEQGEDKDFLSKLKSAVILHDITKEFSVSQHYEVCKKYGIKLSSEDKAIEKVLHAKTAAYIAKIEFGVDDKRIFRGIYNHTLGSVKNFSLFEKIIYLADYIEPERDFVDCIDVRNYFYGRIETAENLKDKFRILDETILYSMNKTLDSLIRENLLIHSDAVRCRNHILKECVVQ